jgi:hypothetical protein
MTGCGRAPCSNITGVSRSAEMGRDTARRSGLRAQTQSSAYHSA